MILEERDTEDRWQHKPIKQRRSGNSRCAGRGHHIHCLLSHRVLLQCGCAQSQISLVARIWVSRSKVLLVKSWPPSIVLAAPKRYWCALLSAIIRASSGAFRRRSCRITAMPNKPAKLSVRFTTAGCERRKFDRTQSRGEPKCRLCFALPRRFWKFGKGRLILDTSAYTFGCLMTDRRLSI